MQVQGWHTNAKILHMLANNQARSSGIKLILKGTNLSTYILNNPKTKIPTLGQLCQHWIHTWDQIDIKILFLISDDVRWRMSGIMGDLPGKKTSYNISPHGRGERELPPHGLAGWGDVDSIKALPVYLKAVVYYRYLSHYESNHEQLNKQWLSLSKTICIKTMRSTSQNHWDKAIKHPMIYACGRERGNGNSLILSCTSSTMKMVCIY
mgnify:CR=1 FL=1